MQTNSSTTMAFSLYDFFLQFIHYLGLVWSKYVSSFRLYIIVITVVVLFDDFHRIDHGELAYKFLEQEHLFSKGYCY